MRQRLDKEMTRRGLVESRSQAENYIRLGEVEVDGVVTKKPGHLVGEASDIRLTVSEKYVSRAGQKLASVADMLKLDFTDGIVLDVGSSTGGFTDYALQHGARKVIAVDVGTEQLHPKLRADSRVELHEKTDIRDFYPTVALDIVVIDVSFISLREILPHVATISGEETAVVAMVKPQFEAGRNQINKGVVKNEALRRKILKEFESWVKLNGFVINNQRDSDISGAKGNTERFYLLTLKRNSTISSGCMT